MHFLSYPGILLRINIDRVILIMFQWPVRTEIYLVVSDVIYHPDCQHKKQQYNFCFVCSY